MSEERRAGGREASSLNIVLIGLMGVGKTTMGMQLARRLHRPFVDTDDVIEAQAGMSIAEIFEREGEVGFRAREQAIVHAIAQEHGQVIAVGGGTATIPENIVALRKTGMIVWLDADPKVLLTRLGSRVARAHRPLIAQARSAQELEETLRTLQLERAEAYAQAAHHVITIERHITRAKIIRMIVGCYEQHTGVSHPTSPRMAAKATGGMRATQVPDGQAPPSQAMPAPGVPDDQAARSQAMPAPGVPDGQATVEQVTPAPGTSDGQATAQPHGDGGPAKP